MTDKEIIQGLIARDNRITTDFFFVKCKPLFYTIISYVFDYKVDYDEFVNELYMYLMEDDAAKLRNFGFRSSVYYWLGIVAVRYFIKKRDHLIDNTSHEPLYDDIYGESTAYNNSSGASEDLARLFEFMPTKRYVYVLRRLIIDGWSPEQLANEMNITTDNLYNIKRRAIAQLTDVALKDIKEYGK